MDPSERTRDTERRLATVLFADITGFTSLNERLDPEDAYRIVTGCIKRLDTIARKHGGSVDKYLGDCLMCVFGIPLALEEAPKAAVNAAIEMRRNVEAFNREHQLEHPLGLHSGINTGLMISGDISGPLLREFAVMGDAVNVASRLKDLAPDGQIWVGPDTWRQTRDDFEYRALDPIRVKGKSQPLAIYEVQSEHERIHRRRPEPSGRQGSPLVGRDLELARLEQRLDGLAGGEGGIAAVVAEAGLGKSRLVSECASSKSGEPVAWLEGRCVTVGENLAFHPFQDLLRAWAGIADTDDDGAAADKLGQACDALLGELAEDARPLLASLLGVRLRAPDRKRLHGVAGESLDKLLFGAVSRVLRALAGQRPTVLVFEDVHWADRSSIEWLEALLPLAARYPLLFLLVARPGFAGTSERLLDRARKEHDARFEEVRLAPLDPSATDQLIDNLLGSALIPSALRDRIEERTQGNPFFVEEVVRSLIDQGALERQEGGLTATERIGEVVIPATVQEVIMARIDRLAPEPKRVLQVASVIGRSCQEEVIADVADADVSEALSELVTLELLSERRRAGHVEYEFRHPLIRDVCYEAILRATRRSLHLAAAHAIEARVAESTPGFNGMLAFHFGLAQDVEAAEEYLFKAGDEAARVAASSEALHFFEQASRLYLESHGEGGDPEKKALLQRKIALAHFNRGQLIEAVEHLDRALEHLGVHVPRRGSVRLARSVATLASVLPQLYVPALERGRPGASDREREILDTLFDLMYKRSQAQTTTDPGRFVTDALEVLRRLWRVDPASVPGSAGVLAGISGMFGYAGSPGLGARFLERAARYADASNVGEYFVYRCFHYIHHFLLGDWSEEHEIDDALVAEALRSGLLWDVTTYLTLLAKKKLYQGRFDAAGQRIEELAKIEDLYAYGLAREGERGCRAFLALERGELEEANRACMVYVQTTDEVLPNVLGLGTQAKVATLRGARDAAREALALARDIVEQAAVVPPFHLSCVWRSELLLALAELEAARAQKQRRAARRALRAAREARRRALRAVGNVAWRQTEVYKLAGRLEWLRGRRGRALAWWGRALDSAEALGARLEGLRVHDEIGRRLQESRGKSDSFRELDAEAHLARAREGLSQLGLPESALHRPPLAAPESG